MPTLSQSLEVYTFRYLLDLALDQVSDEVDKRQGSIIYDALSPTCYMLANVFLQLKQIVDDTFVGTATGDNLDMRASERGLIRNEASKAVKRAVFLDTTGAALTDVAIGTRFSSIGNEPLTYVVKEEISTAGQYLLECEQSGARGNEYAGSLTPISYIQNLGSAIMSDIVIPGEDRENDEGLRARYFDDVKTSAFGGNIAAYDEAVKSIDGVGDAQIYPVWDGGGTVKVSVIDSTYSPATNVFQEQIEAILDPENASGVKGTGLGVAPIGHIVTVVAPTAFIVIVSADVTLASGVNLAQVQPLIDAELTTYIQSVAKGWGTSDDFNRYAASIYTAQIASAILRVNGVNNVTNTKTNGTAADKILTQTAALQELPVLGTVTINVV